MSAPTAEELGILLWIQERIKEEVHTIRNSLQNTGRYSRIAASSFQEMAFEYMKAQPDADQYQFSDDAPSLCIVWPKYQELEEFLRDAMS